MKKKSHKQKRQGFGLRSKFLFILLGSTIVCTLITAFQSLHLTQEALDNGVTKHLTSLRSSRLDQIENYFEKKRAELDVFSKNPLIVEAMREFSAATSLLEHYDITAKPDEVEKLKSHYKKELLAPLKTLTGEVKIVDYFMPKSESARYLQHHYIVNNPAPIGNKQLYESANDGSYYSDLHKKHHDYLLKITEGFGYYDLFLIDAAKSQIVYSVYKELDFATNLETGPYATTNLANTVRRVLNEAEKGNVRTSDYAPYQPSIGKPAAFFAAPIFDGTKLIGVLAAQIPVDQINKLLTNSENWERDGLGETGEVYIVGLDKLMRSDSRFKTEKEEKPGSSILKQHVDNEAVTDALRGNSGIKEVMSYRGYEVLNAYAPLNIPELDWALVVEKSAKEAKAPLTVIEKALLTGASITAAVMTLYALFVSNVFIGPVQSLLSHTEKLNAGEETTALVSNRKDEFGQLTHEVNNMTSKLQAEEEKGRQQEKLLKERLLMVFPPAVAEKFENNEKLIGDRFQNVAITVINLAGFNEATTELSAQESITLLNRLINNFDDAAHNNGVDKVTSQGNLYLAASGLMNPRLDYARSAVAFAEEVLLSIHRFNIAQGSSISAQVGISSGEVVAGVIGKEKPVYNLMGDAVTIANLLAERTVKNSIRIDAPVYNQLLDTEAFNTCELISHPHVGEVANWELPVTTNGDREV